MELVLIYKGTRLRKAVKEVIIIDSPQSAQKQEKGSETTRTEGDAAITMNMLRP